jgi:ElaB/YqjD/DUF883 family membrane-anchored ribosome-binding protein
MDTEHLLDETKRMLTHTEDLLKATAGEAGEKAADARSRIAGRARALRSRLADLEDDLETRARHAARRVDRYAHEHPWETAVVGAAVGAALGALIGVLITRRND